jgi:hypothetical protein
VRSAAVDVSIDEMRTLTLASSSDDGRTVVVERGGVTVSVALPVGAEVFLRAQLRLRELQGASPRALLFADDDGPMRPRFINYAVRAPVAELGVVMFAGGALTNCGIDRKRWANRWGVSVQRLS